MDKKLEYKGANDTVVALGQSAYDGYIGSAVGAAAGAVAGAALHDKTKTESVRTANKTIKDHILATWKKAEHNIDGEGWKNAREMGSGISPEALETAERVLKEEGIIKQVWHSMGRGGKAITGAIIGMTLLNAAGTAIGYFRGERKAKAARQQFEDMASENQILQTKLEATEAQLASSKSFVDSLASERSRTSERTR